MEQNINNCFTSTKRNSNIDIGLFDVTECEKEREELNGKKNYFQQRQNIAIVFVYEHIFCEIEECILPEKCSHSTDNCKDLRAMVHKHKQKKKTSFKNYRKSSKELNALIERK